MALRTTSLVGSGDENITSVQLCAAPTLTLSLQPRRNAYARRESPIGSKTSSFQWIGSCSVPPVEPE
jgi:hypothetical protein